MIEERKKSKQHPSAPTASAVGPCPTIFHISKTPRHWKFIQHHCTTRPPPDAEEPLEERRKNGRPLCTMPDMFRPTQCGQCSAVRIFVKTRTLASCRALQIISNNEKITVDRKNA